MDDIIIETPKSIFLISKEIYNKINDYVKEFKDNKEVGGVLIGYKLKNNEEYRITQFTTPYERDICTYSNFQRLDIGHLKKITEYWEKDRISMYLGDWHFHPLESSTPSCLDYKSWKRLSKSSKTSANQLIYFLITPSKFRYFVYSNKGKLLVNDFIKVIEGRI